MQNVSCPGCGAQVQFKSHASVMAVCEYCKTSILKEAGSIKDIGRMSALLQDYSPLQLGAAGAFGGSAFTVIGRIQQRYPDGLWNEWYLMFDDGSAAWLSDASGAYALTREKAPDATLPADRDVVPSQTYTILGERFTATDIRTVESIAGEGELPLRFSSGASSTVADFRNARAFVTIDWEDGADIHVYAGQAVTLEQLKLQLLRDDDAIQSSSGKLLTKVEALACTSCGSPNRFVPGVTREVICASCGTRQDTTATVAQAIETSERLQQNETTLALGATATISGRKFEIIGVMTRRDEDGEEWTEYLLHGAHAGFLWLIETDEGWSRAKEPDEWPEWGGGKSAKAGKQTYVQLYEYMAEVRFAAGAFNWRVKAGDKVRVVEFEAGRNRLAAEMTPQELTWSLATPVAADQVSAWFGLAADAARKQAARSGTLTDTATQFVIGLGVLNCIPMMFADSDAAWLYFTIAALAIYLPAMALNRVKP